LVCCIQFYHRTRPISGTVALSSPTNSQAEVEFPVEFKWEQFEAAEFYELQYSTTQSFTANKNITEIKGLTYTAIDLSDTTKYYWRVRAYRDAKHSAWSNTWSFTTGFNQSTITAQPILIAPSDEAKGIPLSIYFIWQTVQNASGYHVELSKTHDFSVLVDIDSAQSEAINQEKDITSESTLAKYVSGLDYFTTYYWRVRGVNDVGVGEWSEVWSFTTNRQTDKAPELLLPVNESSESYFFLQMKLQNLVCLLNSVGQLFKTH
jgi:hypothetical protein